MSAMCAAEPTEAPAQRVVSDRLSDDERASLLPLLRRTPEQSRSWQRVLDVLQAGQSVLEEQGLEAVLHGPHLIAERAGMPTGTFYSYFENSEAVVQCLRQLGIRRIYGVGDREFAQPSAVWQDAADRLVDAIVRFFEAPSARMLWMVHQLPTPVRITELEANRYLGLLVRGTVEQLGMTFLGDDNDLLVLVEIADRLTRFAHVDGRAATPDPVLVDRAKRATRAYLATVIATPET